MAPNAKFSRCPEDKLPQKDRFQKLGDNKDIFHLEPSERKASPEKNTTTFRKNIIVGEKYEFRKILTDIKDFSANAMTARERKSYFDSKLVRLGLPPTKQRKMPFRMRVGINSSKRKREKSASELAQISGQVLAKSAGDMRRNKKRKRNPA